MIKLKHLFYIYAGATPKSDIPEYWDGNIFWATPSDYKTQDKYIYNTARKLSIKGYEASNTTIVPPGSIIVSKRAPVGTVCMTTVPLCTNQGCLSCVPKTELDIDFYYYVLASMSDKMQILASGTTFQEISANAFANMKVCYPEILVQNKISKYLNFQCSKIDEAVSRHESIIEKLEEYRRSAITHVVTKGLDKTKKTKPVDSPWIQSIPETWKYAPLKSLFRTVDIRNTDPNAKLLSLYTAIGVKPREELEERGNKAVTVLNYKIVKKNDVIVNKLLAWMGAIAYSDYDGVTSPDYDVYRALDDANVVREYYHYYFRYTNFKDDCYMNGHGLMMMRWRTYPDELLRIKVPNPPYEEQKAIGEYAHNLSSKIDRIISRQKVAIEKLEEYRKSIIYHAVTGKIDCRNYTDSCMSEERC